MRISIFSLFVFCALLAVSQTFNYVRQITGTSFEKIRDMVVDGSGNTYVVGTFEGTVQLGSQTYTAGGSDIWIAKYNSSGTHQWGKVIPDTGTAGDDAAYGIDLDGSNNVYIYGSFIRAKNFNPGGSGGTVNATSGLFFAKYTSSGNFSYVKTFNNTGGVGDILVSTSQNKIFLSGSFSGTNIDFDPGPGNFSQSSSAGGVFLGSYNLNGTLVSVKQFGAQSNVNSIVEDSGGNIYITGALNGTSINFNHSGTGTSFNSANGRVYIARYFNNLSFHSAVQLSGSDLSFKNGIAIDHNNDVYVTGGGVSDDPFYAKYNSSLSQIFQKNITGGGTVDAILDIVATGSGTYITGQISGSNVSLGNGITVNPVGSSDVLMAKYNSSGTPQWGRVLGTSGSANGAAIDLNGSKIRVAGDFTSNADFNACLNTASFTANSRDAFLVEYTDGAWYGNPSISGPGHLCNSAQGTFTINNFPTGASVSWQKSSNLTIVSGQGTPSFRVKVNSSATPGNAWVKATVSSDCGSYTLNTSQFWAGKPRIVNPLSGPTQMMPGQQANFTVNNSVVGPVTNYEWIIPSGCHFSHCWQIISGQGIHTAMIQAGNPGLQRIEVRAHNSCGYDASYLWVNVQNPSDPCNALSVSPNPAKGSFVINIKEPCDPLPFITTTESTLTVRNLTGETVFSKKNVVPGKPIRATRLKPGLYMLEYINGSEASYERLVVE